MPYDGQKIPFPRLQKYLSGVIAWHPTDMDTHSYVRQGVKWFFDLVYGQGPRAPRPSGGR
jgi:hypothetical protein